MNKLAGYIFTLFYLVGAFFPIALPGPATYLSQLFGHLAFAFFALLVARGARRTSNHFLYFVRLLLAALATESLLYVAGLKLAFYLPERNALFTYAAAIAMIAGISMALGCYHDLVARAVPAGGELDKKTLFGVPVNPGNYRIAPATGIILGLATAGLSLFLTLYFDFSHGFYGILYVFLAFIAMREATGAKRPFIRDTIFEDRSQSARALLYLTGLTAAAFLLSCFFENVRARVPLGYLAALAAVPLASILPEGPRLPDRIRRLPYLTLPVMIGIFFLLLLYL